MEIELRIERVQKKLGVDADGIVGVETLSALERALGIVTHEAITEPEAHSPPAGHKGLVLSRGGIAKIIGFEISSEGYYNSKLTAPTWPGGASGVTIGIGYDLGYRTKGAIRADWSSYLPQGMVDDLTAAAGIRGADAKGVARSLKQAGVRVPLEAAQSVFSRVAIPEYAALTREVYPGTDKLPADAQTALVSLVYNRGGRLSGQRRLEMLNIRSHVKKQNLPAIADEIVAMKRLWIGKGLDGLLDRRDAEAALVRGSARAYDTSELIYV